ncbi:hypothetical protein pdul_cds_33 [Pandoravirus dulcis]|uniref:Uncharacterized protein n=1 Tax=Pandoravirus dulcis TaxID=1349409 RepID=S4VRC1_9VIRU|nr:hypothetical protein pdul_cds_33 [Pandoravirus dulcis]AGO81910.1 hypothetical protein pdul_cds_33 [Pandoravirus dulcis]
MEQDQTAAAAAINPTNTLNSTDVPNLPAAIDGNENGATEAGANSTAAAVVVDGRDDAVDAMDSEPAAQQPSAPEAAPAEPRTYAAPLGFCAVDATQEAGAGDRADAHNDDDDDDNDDFDCEADLDVDLNDILLPFLNAMGSRRLSMVGAGETVATTPDVARPSDPARQHGATTTAGGGAKPARSRPDGEDEPQAKRHCGPAAPSVPRRPRGRPPGRANGQRRRPIMVKRFAREAPDALVREECVERVVRTRLDAVERDVDGRHAVDAVGVRLLSADNASLPAALCFRRTLEPLAEERMYTCVSPGCGRAFSCLAQNALIGCTGARSGPAAAADLEDAPDAEDRLARAAEGMHVEGFVCPLHGEHHAYCAQCLLAHLDLDTPVAGMDDHDYSEAARAAADAQLAGRWPVRCPGSVRVWIEAPPSVGMCALPPGATVAAIDPAAASVASVARCPFVLGPRFARALVERCPPADVRYALRVTLGMAEMQCAQDEHIGATPDDGDDPDLYNRDEAELEAELDNEHDAARAMDSVARRALRLTRQRGLARLMAAAEVEYRRHAAATNPHYWVSPCPYEHCVVSTHVDRMTVFGVVCIPCTGCRRLHCSGCRQGLDGCDAATVDRHTHGCYDYRHAPWFDGDDVHFLGRFLRDPATAAAASDPNRPARPEPAGVSEAQGARTLLQILLDTAGGAGVRRAIAARIAECLLRADRNGSSQRCPTCQRRVNLAEARAHTAAAAAEALTRARAAGDLAAMDAHARRLAGVYATTVDTCACGTMWCYLCERVTPTSRAQRRAIQDACDDSSLGPRVDSGISAAPYSALSADFDPPPAELHACPPAPGVAEGEQAPAGAERAEVQAWWTQRESARAYWHEAPEHGPWRHTADWSRHERASQRCEAHTRNDPLWARKWPACPPSMADLGDLRDAGFVDPKALSGAPLSSSSSSSSSSLSPSLSRTSSMPLPLARALAGRANLERFHVAKRQRLVAEAMRHIEAVPWIGPDMVAAIRGWLPADVWRRLDRTHGAFCRLADAAVGVGARPSDALALARLSDAAMLMGQPQQPQQPAQRPHPRPWVHQHAQGPISGDASAPQAHHGSAIHGAACRGPTDEDHSWVEMLSTPIHPALLQQ